MVSCGERFKYPVHKFKHEKTHHTGCKNMSQTQINQTQINTPSQSKEGFSAIVEKAKEVVRKAKIVDFYNANSSPLWELTSASSIEVPEEYVAEDEVLEYVVARAIEEGVDPNEIYAIIYATQECVHPLDELGFIIMFNETGEIIYSATLE